MEYRVDVGIKNMEKKGRKHTFWTFLGHVYRYTLNVYRYTCCSVPNFDQFSYVGHNFLISYPI